MTRILLCAGPGLLVVQNDGLLYFRRPDQADAPIPYAPANYPVFLRSAKEKHHLTVVIGPDGAEAPLLPPSEKFPTLCRDRLATGEEVYRLMAPVADGTADERAENIPCPLEKGQTDRLAPR